MPITIPNISNQAHELPILPLILIDWTQIDLSVHPLLSRVLLLPSLSVSPLSCSCTCCWRA